MQRLKQDLGIALGNLQASSLREPLVQLLDVTTNHKPTLGYAGPLAMAVLMAEQLGRDVHEDIVMVRRALHSAERGPFNEHVRAMRDMVNGEIRNRLT